MKLLKPPSKCFKPRHRKVLAICGDTQVGLWMLRNLGANGLAVYSICRTPQGLAAHSRFSHGSWVLDSPADEAALVNDIESLARKLDVGSIMPIDEYHHSALIKNRHRLEPDIHIFSPSAPCFRQATDKNYLHQLCRQLGIPVARGTTLDQLIASPQKQMLSFPLVLRTGDQVLSGARRAPFKAAYAVNAEQLRKFNQDLSDIAANILVQEYHPGVEIHIQILMYRGQAFMLGEYIGEHHMPLAGGVTVQRITCRHEHLIRDAVRLLQAIDWEGIAAVQYHYDPASGDYIFLEINPRFCGGLPTVIMAGFDAPFLLWQSHFEPEKMKVTHYRLNLRTRILGGDANWMLAMIRGDELPPDQKRLPKFSAFCRFLWNFGPWTKDDVFLLRDLKPAWIDWKNMLQRLTARHYDII